MTTDFRGRWRSAQFCGKIPPFVHDGQNFGAWIHRDKIVWQNETLATAGTESFQRSFKELIAFAISIAGRCDGCVAYHAKKAAEAGATREEILETIGVAVQMGGGPSMVYGGEALRAYDSFGLEATRSAA